MKINNKHLIIEFPSYLLIMPSSHQTLKIVLGKTQSGFRKSSRRMTLQFGFCPFLSFQEVFALQILYKLKFGRQSLKERIDSIYFQTTRGDKESCVGGRRDFSIKKEKLKETKKEYRTQNMAKYTYKYINNHNKYKQTKHSS